MEVEYLVPVEDVNTGELLNIVHVRVKRYDSSFRERLAAGRMVNRVLDARGVSVIGTRKMLGRAVRFD